MASPQPPPGPLGNGSDGPTDKQQSTSEAAQPVVEILGGDAYAAIIVCALLLLNMTSGMQRIIELSLSMLCHFDDQRHEHCVQPYFVLQFS